MMALKVTVLKKRLAYSSVSQGSYVTRYLRVAERDGLSGRAAACVLPLHHENLLFLCAGGIILKTGLTDVRDLRGIGKRMPATLWCFTSRA